MTKKYSKQFKGECIEMVVGLGMRSQEVGKQMNVPYQTVDMWVNTLHKGINKRRSHNTLHIEVRKWKS